MLVKIDNRVVLIALVAALVVALMFVFWPLVAAAMRFACYGI